MRTVFSLVGILCISGALFSQTNVSGPIFSNTTWSANAGPYKVNGNVQLPPGVTLTIEPGTVIDVTGEYEILVKGAVIAEGTSSATIKVTAVPSQFRPVFMFRGSNLDNSRLSHIDVYGNKIAFQVGEIGDTIQPSGLLAVSNLKIVHGQILTMGANSGASVQIVNSSFLDARVETYHYSQTEPIEVTNCTFSNSSVSSGKGKITVTDCSFESSYLHVIFGTMQVENTKLNSSEALDNTGAGGIYSFNSCELNNSRIAAWQLHLSDCIINTNSAYAVGTRGGTIECTRVTGNGTGVGFTFGGGGQVNMYNCAVSSESIGIWVANVNSFICDSLNVFNNVAYNVKNSHGANLSFGNVYWGAGDSAGIAAKIYDYYDDINSGKCFFPSPRSSQYTSSLCAVSLTVSTGPGDVGVGEIQRNGTLNVYPNPAGPAITVRCPDQKFARGEIMSSEGKVVKGFPVDNSEKVLDISDLDPGFYFVRVTSSGSVTYGRFVKE